MTTLVEHGQDGLMHVRMLDQTSTKSQLRTCTWLQELTTLDHLSGTGSTTSCQCLS